MVSGGKMESKRVAIVATDGVEQVEILSPIRALENAGVRVDVIAPKGGTIRAWKHTDWGESIKVDRTLDELGPMAADEYDALLLPGGVINADALRREHRAHTFIRRFFDEDAPVAVICHGAWVLIDAGMVRGRRITSYRTLECDLRNAGAQWEDRPVLIDGNLISSRRPDDLPAFEDALLGALESPPRRMAPGHAHP